jgi:hypothetical protein
MVGMGMFGLTVIFIEVAIQEPVSQSRLAYNCREIFEMYAKIR